MLLSSGASLNIETLNSSYMALSSDAIIVRYIPPGSGDPCVVYVNQAFISTFGHTLDDLSGDILLGLSQSQCWEKHLTNPKAPLPETQARFARQDGTPLWAVISLIVVDDDDGTGVHVCTTLRALPYTHQTSLGAGNETRTPIPTGWSHERFVAALNAYPDPIVIYGPDLRLVSWNHGYTASVTDRDADLVTGMHLRDVLLLAVKNGRYPDAVGREQDWIDGILSRESLESPCQDVELDGDIHHRLLRSRSSNGDYVVVRLNATELVRQKRQAEAAQSRLIAALNAYPSPFVIYDSDDCLVVWNDAYRQSMTDDPEKLQAGLHRTEVARIAIQAGKIASAKGREQEWMSDDHQQKAVAKPVQDIELADDVHHRLLRSRAKNGDLVIVRLDTTELVRQRRTVERYAQKLEQANRIITHAAHHDDLTGLGNRRLLKIKLDALAQRRRKDGGEIAALHIDLDRFKQINDTMGHPAGDKVLLVTSRRIQDCVAPGDVVARIGGDEFVVLMHVPKGSPRPVHLAKTLLAALSRPTQHQGKECRFGASIGLAQTPLVDVEQLLTTSDVALYKAKHRGRGQLGVFDRADLLKGHRNETMADDVSRGIARCEFEPFYQPQVNAETGDIVGLDVLIRWQHPVRGMLEPCDFQAVVEDLNMAGDLDRMIFEKAITACTSAFSGKAPPLPLSFTVSASRVIDADFDATRKHVNSYPGQIGFALLETILFEEEDYGFLNQLKRLKDLGIKIEVSDFGSGRASLVPLQQMNPDRLKIDSRLIAQAMSSDGGFRLVRSIVQVGQSLQIDVTADGVETQEQAKTMTELGCDRLTGPFIARPMPLDQLLGHLAV